VPLGFDTEWNNSKQMNDKITTEEIKELAQDFGINWRYIKMLIIVESSGRGFNDAGNVILRFEEKKFLDRAGVLIINDHKNQTSEYAAYNKAKTIDREAADLSTSWGMGQIMGNEHDRAGYETVDRMIGEFKISEYYQVKGMIAFCRSKPKLWLALTRRELSKEDFKTIAYYYNGPKYNMHNPPYNIRLETTLLKISA
jgi:hypothetical protein